MELMHCAMGAVARSDTPSASSDGQVVREPCKLGASKTDPEDRKRIQKLAWETRKHEKDAQLEAMLDDVLHGRMAVRRLARKKVRLAKLTGSDGTSRSSI